MATFQIFLTNPATAAVAVAIAGMILPAMRLVLSLSAGSMEYILALRADADVTKSMWPLLSSSFSNCSGLICNLSTCETHDQQLLKQVNILFVI